MKRTEIKTKYLKHKTSISLKAYKQQRNFCSKLYKKERKNDNKELWRTIKPFLSEKISLVEKGKLLWNKAKIAETFNDFLKNAVNKPGINRDDDKFSDGPVLSTNPFDTAIQKFDNHPSAN